MATPEPMTPELARRRIGTFHRVSVGRARIQRVEEALQVRLLDIIKDDDLVVIFAEEMMLQSGNVTIPEVPHVDA